MTPPEAGVRRRRLQLLALAALFLGPLGLAALVYFASDLRPAGHLQHGELLDPPRPLPAASLARADGGATAPDFLHHHWSLVTVAHGACGARCATAIETMRIARLALDADAARVQRVLLVDAACCGGGAPAAAELASAWLDSKDGAALLAALGSRSAPVPEDGRILLVDPLGNLVLSYAPGVDAKDLLKDLARLLRLSAIG
jgi:hypothetical protein